MQRLRLFRLLTLLAALLAPSGAWAANCVTTAYAHPTSGSSPWQWSGATTWATTSGGATACTLTAGNAVVFDSGSTAGTYVTEAISVASIATVNATAGITISGTSNITISAGGADVSGVTWSSTGAMTFTNTSGTNNIKTGGNTFGSNLVLNGTGGTFELLDNFVNSGAITLTAGTLDASTNNPNVTTSSVTGAGNLTCGTGIWNINNNNVNPSFSVSGTISCASATLSFGSIGAVTGSRAFVTNGSTYGTVTIVGQATPTQWQFTITISSGATIGTLNLNGACYCTMTTGQTLTLTNLNIAGTVTNPVLLLTGQSGVQTTTLTVTNSPTINYAALAGIAFTNAATATNSFNFGGNTNLTITPPSGGHIIGS